jgi:hypothetical protein
MELANCWLILDKQGSNVPLHDITPAELIMHVQARKDFVGRFPVHDLVITKQSRRSDAAERDRLRMKMGKKPGSNSKAPFKVDEVFPGALARLPLTFAETGLLEESVAVKLDEPKPDMPDFDPEALAQLDEALVKEA